MDSIRSDAGQSPSVKSALASSLWTLSPFPCWSLPSTRTYSLINLCEIGIYTEVVLDASRSFKAAV